MTFTPTDIEPFDTTGLAANVTEKLDRIRRFLDIVNARERVVKQTDNDHRHRPFAIERDYYATNGEVTIEQKTETAPIVISINEQTAGPISNIRGPLEYWTVSQSIDDGNLLTELKLNHDNCTASVTVYGPTARYSGTEISLPNVDESKFILD